jgi:hypothetical protein
VEAERGLSHMQCIRRFGDGSAVDDAWEITKLTKVHGISTEPYRTSSGGLLIPKHDRKERVGVAIPRVARERVICAFPPRVGAAISGAIVLQTTYVGFVRTRRKPSLFYFSAFVSNRTSSLQHLN